MNDDQKNRFDAIATLRSWAWDSFDKRRNFEWKVSFGLWTAQVTLIGILFTKDVRVQPCLIKLTSIVLGAMVFSLHCMFLRGVAKAHKLDRDLSSLYDQLLDDFGPFLTEKIKNEVAARRKNWGWVLHDYSHRFQLEVTLLLSFCLVAISFSK
jgi:hypothetical protein